MQKDDAFELYDLRVEVISDGVRPMVCNHQIGDSLTLSGENFSLPDGQSFPIYCLAALIPILTVKQRMTDPNDWISTDEVIACPDVNCGGRFKITRLNKRTFYHHQVTKARESNHPKIIRGCWQLAAGHSGKRGDISPILDAVACGFTTFDCADIYLGVEELLGRAIAAVPEIKLRIHTKFVPDLNRLHDIDRPYIEKIIDRSLRRLGVDCLDLVQFHWWDWEVKNYLFAMETLMELKAKGKIAAIGLTNVNRHYLEELSTRFPLASLQAQLSLFDRRVERGVGELCRERGIKLFAYGSLLGGFVSEKWLGAQEPELESLANRSLVKYKLLIDSACGWEAFQSRLHRLGELASKYGCEIAAIVLAALLQGRKADAVIVGLSPQNFTKQNRELAKLPALEAHELQEIISWPCLLKGDVYDEERDESSAHAKIMKYNLNAE